LTDHDRRGVLHPEERTAHVDRHRGVEALYIDLGDTWVRRKVTGIVEEAVEPAKALDRMLNQHCNICLD
jgi:hypothetical protein